MNEDKTVGYVVSYTKLLGAVALHDNIATTLKYETALTVAEENLELNGKRWESGILEISERNKYSTSEKLVTRWWIKDGKVVKRIG